MVMACCGAHYALRQRLVLDYCYGHDAVGEICDIYY